MVPSSQKVADSVTITKSIRLDRAKIEAGEVWLHQTGRHYCKDFIGTVRTPAPNSASTVRTLTN
jgi:hypothetical protein